MNTAAARGNLRLYLGAAPGVGKTYAMLAEAHRLRARGTDVVAGLVETHGRRVTAQLAEGLDTVPRRVISYRGHDFTEMDVDAVLARHPEVALVDELAHTNVPGSRNAKRWQDVEELLSAGIDVITTLNIQHLESLSDVTWQVTGVQQRETLPDEIARRADQIELVDMTPEALRRRMMHGNVYPPDRVEAALTHYFRPGNLTALRELALLWVADRVEEGLQRYRAEHGIATPWETRERIVVALAGENGAGGDAAVIRRAARIAARTPGSDLLAVHVSRDDGLADDHDPGLDTQRALVASLGGSFHQMTGDDVATALLEFARVENASQIVLGASRRGRVATLLAGKSTPTRLARRADHIDVHLVSRKGTPGRSRAGHRLVSALRTRRTRARRARETATALTRLAVSVLSGHGDPPALLEEIRQMFGLTAVSLLEQHENHDDGTPRWYVVASAGDRPPETPDAPVAVPVAGAYALAGRGRTLSHADRRVLAGCAGPMVAGLVRRWRDEQDARAARKTADVHSRAALLAAVNERAGRQLETARAALTRADTVTALHAVDQASRLLADLGELRRLHAGALETYLRSVDLEEVLAACWADLGPGAPEITLSIPADLPDVIADAELLTRILTSLIAGALHRGEGDRPPAVVAAGRDGQIEVRVTSQGSRGQDAASRRQGNGTSDLSLRVARDLAGAMGAGFGCVDDADGNRTVTLTLPAATRREAGNQSS